MVSSLGHVCMLCCMSAGLSDPPGASRSPKPTCMCPWEGPRGTKGAFRAHRAPGPGTALPPRGTRVHEGLRGPRGSPGGPVGLRGLQGKPGPLPRATGTPGGPPGRRPKALGSPRYGNLGGSRELWATDDPPEDPRALGSMDTRAPGLSSRGPPVDPGEF